MESKEKKVNNSHSRRFGRVSMWIFILPAMLVVSSVPSAGEQLSPADDDPAFYQGPDFGYRNPDWMGRLPDDMLISELSIPGTHETMSRGIGYSGDLFSWLYCHSMGLATQLKGGIRAIDMRCQNDQDRFVIHHAGRVLFGLFGEDDPWRNLVDGTYGWTNVLGTCVEFLRENPTETIVMLVQWAVCIEGVIDICGAKGIPWNTTRSFAETFAWYRDESGCTIEGELAPYRDYIWQPDGSGRMPTLGEVRGKIVIIQEFPATYRVGIKENTDSDSYRVCSADLNGDSFPDLVCNVWDEGQVAVLLNRADGTGTFDRASRYDTGNYPSSVTSADFNGDSYPDIAVSSCEDHQVSILLNEGGNGTFASTTIDYYVGRYPRAVLAADLDGDSCPDIVTADGGDNTVSILLNTCSGGRSFHQSYAVPVGTNPIGVVAADFNGDSYNDLAVTNWTSSTISILLNDPGNPGIFSSAAEYPSGYRPWIVCSADFDGDSCPDLAVANCDANQVSVLFNDGGTGNFSTRVAYDVGKQPLSVSSADYNGDSYPDLAVTNYGSRNVSVLINRGDGTGQFAIPPREYKYGSALYAGLNPSSVTSADFNGDDFPDLAVMSKELKHQHDFVYSASVYQNRADRTGRFLKYGGFGISWESLHVQNFYSVNYWSHEQKWDSITCELHASREGEPDRMHMNFLTGAHCNVAFPISYWYPWKVAIDMNPRFYDYCRDVIRPYNDTGATWRCGIIMTDLPGAGLVDIIIERNDFPSNEDVFTPLPYVVLYQNSPNPCNPATTIRFNLPENEFVRLSVYDVAGRLVRTLVQEQMEPGLKEIFWDGRDGSGYAMASGIYLYNLRAGEHSESRKMVLLR